MRKLVTSGLGNDGDLKVISSSITELMPSTGPAPDQITTDGGRQCAQSREPCAGAQKLPRCRRALNQVAAEPVAGVTDRSRLTGAPGFNLPSGSIESFA